MRITHENGIYQLTFYNQSGLSVNCYLLEEEKDLTLIDTAIHGSGKEIVEAAAQIGKPIQRIVLTHVHHDHIGGLDAITEIVTDASVFIPRRDARLLSGDLTLDPDEPDTPIRGNIPNNLRTAINVFINDGDRIGYLLAIASPGHTPGSMSFMDTRSHALIAGDAFQTEGGIAVAGQLRPVFPFPTYGTWNKEIALKSAIKLRQYKPSILAVGHGEMLKQPLEDMDRAIAEAAYNLNAEK